MSDLFDEVVNWLAYKRASTREKPDVLRELWPSEPEQPEALALLYQMRNFSLSYWPGGLADQPAILVMELNQCIKAEQEDQRIEAENLVMAAVYAAKTGA